MIIILCGRSFELEPSQFPSFYSNFCRPETTTKKRNKCSNMRNWFAATYFNLRYKTQNKKLMLRLKEEIIRLDVYKHHKIQQQVCLANNDFLFRAIFYVKMANVFIEMKLWSVYATFFRPNLLISFVPIIQHHYNYAVMKVETTVQAHM